jgi:hypothetical protein
LECTKAPKNVSKNELILTNLVEESSQNEMVKEEKNEKANTSKGLKLLKEKINKQINYNEKGYKSEMLARKTAPSMSKSNTYYKKKIANKTEYI